MCLSMSEVCTCVSHQRCHASITDGSADCARSNGSGTDPLKGLLAPIVAKIALRRHRMIGHACPASDTHVSWFMRRCGGGARTGAARTNGRYIARNMPSRSAPSYNLLKSIDINPKPANAAASVQCRNTLTLHRSGSRYAPPAAGPLCADIRRGQEFPRTIELVLRLILPTRAGPYRLFGFP